MGKYTVTRNYRANTAGTAVAFDEGATVDVDDDLAGWVNRDSPGTLEPATATKKTSKKTSKKTDEGDG